MTSLTNEQAFAEVSQLLHIFCSTRLMLVVIAILFEEGDRAHPVSSVPELLLKSAPLAQKDVLGITVCYS